MDSSERDREIRYNEIFVSELEQQLKKLKEEEEYIRNSMPSFRDQMYGVCDRNLEINVQDQKRIEEQISNVNLNKN